MRLISATPVLRVGDYPAARTFWCDIMGFAVLEEGGTPARFGIFGRDKATVFVDGWHGADAVPSPGWRAYLHCDDVDALAASIADKLAFEGPYDAVYGMRELVLRDPAGNLLCFGQELPS